MYNYQKSKKNFINRINFDECINKEKVRENVTLYVNHIMTVQRVAKQAGYPLDNDGAMDWLSKMNDSQRSQFGISPDDYEIMKLMYTIDKIK